MRDIFRRAFEARYKPLDVDSKEQKLEKRLVHQEEELEDSDWSGISDDDDGGTVEVVDVSNAKAASERASKAEMRAFMSSKPPTSTPTAALAKATSKPTDADDPTEASHLKNDLALQKLLRDSHLLSSASTSGTSTPTLALNGAARHKSTDLHLLSLGAKSSIHAQKSMPMSHRKGITLKAREKEQKRRSEAREGGIVLEKEVRKRKFLKEREKGVGGPGVGRFKGGTLSLSKRDVADITGSRGSKGGSKAGRKGKR